VTRLSFVVLLFFSELLRVSGEEAAQQDSGETSGRKTTDEGRNAVLIPTD